MAITNQHSSIYLICQLVCGAVFPGRPVANMVFVTYGYISSAQGIKFSADLKLGHYMKIPPRLLFSVQNGSHSRCLNNPNRRPELDVPQRPRHLHTRCN